MTLRLYLLIRNDLHSMNSGKAISHGAHAANAFAFDTRHRIAKGSITSDKMEEWEGQSYGCGTTVSLSTTKAQLLNTVKSADALHAVAGTYVDPTYPYLLEPEYAALINHENMVSDETLNSGTINPGNAPTPWRDGRMLCLRRELTAGYVFGDSDVLRPVLEQLEWVGDDPRLPHIRGAS